MGVPDSVLRLACRPYGSVGSVLWVRETWQPLRTQTEAQRAKVAKILERFRSGQVTDIVAEAQAMSSVGYSGETQCLYAADFGEWAYHVDSDLKPWKPSIFMPRKFCRIVLRITDVRVQRVQDISANDCFAEGIAPMPCLDCDQYMELHRKDEAHLIDPRPEYETLWNKINGNWKDNPWVWVVGFERITEKQK